MKKYIIITNNPLVKELYGDKCRVDFQEGSYRDSLVRVRDFCHKGHRLLSHPLSGSVKPNETIYKSVMISLETGETDTESIELIEKAIMVCDKFGKTRRNWRERELNDFRVVDSTLIASAIESAEEGFI